MTPEERVRQVIDSRPLAWTWDEMAARFADAIRSAVDQENEVCARIVEAGDDGIHDLLEIAIQGGTNAALAAALRLRRAPPEVSERYRKKPAPRG